MRETTRHAIRGRMAFTACLLALALGWGGAAPRSARATSPAAAAPTSVAPHAKAPDFDDTFWKYWGDGQAEVAGYALQFSRYGAVRAGTAVTVFVTETFSNSLRVKADPGRHPAADESRRETP